MIYQPLLELTLCRSCATRHGMMQLESPSSVCYICNNAMLNIINYAEKAVKLLEGYEFDSFNVGSVFPEQVIERDRELAKRTNAEMGIKREFNSLIAKFIQERLHANVERKEPTVLVLVNLKEEKVEIVAKSLYVYGEYQKLVRGIPQAKWLCRKCKGSGCPYCNWLGKMYETSVQEIIEKPLIEQTKAEKSSIHACGREDIDVRNLGWRQFVIELVNPRLRKLNLARAEEEINSSQEVRVRNLFLTNKEAVTTLKRANPRKKYQAVVTFEGSIDLRKLDELKKLIGSISQRTPRRVSHRRADLVRKRQLYSIGYEKISENKVKLIMEVESGMYVKELITGDGGRTFPSVSQVLGRVRSIELDVIDIERVEIKHQFVQI